jgi:cytochrome c oxidase assembly protein subunit 15
MMMMVVVVMTVSVSMAMAFLVMGVVLALRVLRHNQFMPPFEDLINPCYLSPMKSRHSFSVLLKWLIFYTLLVIIWGAWVRISHSGDGCGDTWPLCHGQIIPEAERGKTWVEYFHRLTSGLFGLVIIYMYFQSRKLFEPGFLVRRWAGISLLFTITEALLGAKLVIFQLVGTNDTPFRAFAMSLHLINSLLLTASIFLTYDFSKHSQWQRVIPKNPIPFSTLRWTILLLILFGILGVSGAIAALANTLYPSESLVSGIFDDFSKDSHFLVRLRTFHPLLGILIGGGLCLFAKFVSDEKSSLLEQKNRGYLVSLMAGSTVVVGLITLFTLSPIPLKVVHLMMAHLVWLSLVAWLRTLFYTKSDTSNREILFFDGVCNLCNRSVDHVVRFLNPLLAQKFFVAPLQGTTAKKLLPAETLQSLSTVVLFKNEVLYKEFSAVRETFKSLSFWHFLIGTLLEIVPSFIGNIFYRLIAQNRYSWFGRRDSCRLPTAEEQKLFLN